MHQLWIMSALELSQLWPQTWCEDSKMCVYCAQINEDLSHISVWGPALVNSKKKKRQSRPDQLDICYWLCLKVLPGRLNTSPALFISSHGCVCVCHHLRAPLKASAWRGCLKVCSHPRWMVTMTTLSDSRLFCLPPSTAIWTLLSSDTLHQPMFKSSPSLSVPAAVTLTLVFFCLEVVSLPRTLITRFSNPLTASDVRGQCWPHCFLEQRCVVFLP